MKNLNLYALWLFISGFTLPVITMILARFLDKEKEIDSLAGVLGFICEILAVIFAIFSWKEKFSKFIVISVTLVIILLFVILFFPSRGNF